MRPKSDSSRPHQNLTGVVRRHKSNKCGGALVRITLFCFPHGFSSPLLSKNGYCQDMSSPWVVGTCLVACTGAGPAQSIRAAATGSSHDSAPAGSCYLTRITALAKTSHTRCLPYRLMHYLNKKAFIYLILHFDFMRCSSSEWLFQL